MYRGRTSKLLRIWQTGLWALLFALSTAIADEGPTPHEVIEKTVSAMSDRLDGRIAYFDDNRDELYELIEELLVPNFDTRYAGRLVLGQHWSGATKEQRNQFIDVFYRFLLQSYANGILEFEQDSITILPPDGDVKDQKRRVVKTQMRLDDGSNVPINYSMRKSSAGWRVYDVRIEGVSYIHNYRNQFNAEISALGVDSVIENLNQKIASSEVQ